MLRRPFHRTAFIGLATGLVTLIGFQIGSGQTLPTFRNFRVIGEVVPSGEGLKVTGKKAILILDGGTTDIGKFVIDLQPAKTPGTISLVVNPKDPADLTGAAAGRVDLARDKEGLSLTGTGLSYDPESRAKWTRAGSPLTMNYWPNPKARGAKTQIEALTAAGMEPGSWHGRTFRLTAEIQRDAIEVWLGGIFLNRVAREPGTPLTLALHLLSDDVVLAAGAEIPLRTPPFNPYQPVDVQYLANDRFPQAVGKTSHRVGAVPFELASGAKDHVSLRHAHWAEVKVDPSSYYESYDYGPAIVGDPTMPMLRVPAADYSAIHLLAVADADPNLTNTITLRCGRYGGAGQVLHHDFVATVPRADEPKVKPVLDTPAGPLYHVRVPLDKAFAQDLLEGILEIELTKEVYLARRQPDPNRFRERPLGLPSGVRIAAVTLERSPLQMHVGSAESGHAFTEPQTPTFSVRLTNVTPTAQPYKLLVTAKHLHGTTITTEAAGQVDANATATVPLTITGANRGYHDISVTLRDRSNRPVLTRTTAMALLPPDTRQHRAQSPFGTWDFFGGHFTCNDPDKLGPLYVKLGMRYSMMRTEPDVRAKYGLLPGHEPRIEGTVETYLKYREREPDLPKVGLIFHENSISGKHVTRVPDYFTDRPPYEFDEAETKRFDTMWETAIKGAKAARELDPAIHLRLGNGPLPTKEAFYQRKYPADLFDSGGNEAGNFGRFPETQPPDFIANNASIWMDRQLLDGYGYKDKPVTQCYEVCYPATNPGNLDERTQADYFVRHALHSLAWGIEEFRPGCISDMGNSYYFSNWGATGFCRRHPELSVKPSFVAFATMTRVLDGAKFVRVVPAGSESVYALEFTRPDGSTVLAAWTLRGTRPLAVTVSGSGPWKLIDDQAAETSATPKDGAIDIPLSSSVRYLVGAGKIESAKPGKIPLYREAPAGGKSAVVLAPLADLSGWLVEPGRDAELEYYNFMTPRRKGDFQFESIKSSNNQGLKVTPKPLTTGKPTMPMYAVLRHEAGLPIAGTPTELGVWVNGNSGWGRILFEFTDAGGQRWISLGAQQKGDNRWLEDMVPKELLAKSPPLGLSDWNTEDVFGTSRINFDGWRYLAFPLPGNYPGEHYPWPANSQWRWDGDGVVKYPITVRKLIVELPEKVLHVRDYAPPKRPEIYLRDLTAGFGPLPTAKK